MRVALIALVEVVGLVALLVFAATVAIPWAAPPPSSPTPTIPFGALHDCPPFLHGC
ncbi:MAG TPA: hypothetical protein VFG86_07005 [Chloroflexota bacterium]|nr:hypothetical protein [Chloroflexota bacterium]